MIYNQFGVESTLDVWAGVKAPLSMGQANGWWSGSRVAHESRLDSKRPRYHQNLVFSHIERVGVGAGAGVGVAYFFRILTKFRGRHKLKGWRPTTGRGHRPRPRPRPRPTLYVKKLNSGDIGAAGCESGTEPIKCSLCISIGGYLSIAYVLSWAHLRQVKNHYAASWDNLYGTRASAFH